MGATSEEDTSECAPRGYSNAYLFTLRHSVSSSVNQCYLNATQQHSTPGQYHSTLVELSSMSSKVVLRTNLRTNHARAAPSSAGILLWESANFLASGCVLIRS